MKTALAWCVTALVGAGISVAARADLVYVQPPVAPEVGTWTGASSRWTDNTPSQSITADAFQLNSEATITGVKFWGRFIWTASAAAPTQFHITIYNSDGAPSFNGVSPAPGSVHAAFTLNVNDPGFSHTPASDPFPLVGHDLYEATLPSAVHLLANTRYWISIAGVGPADGLPWAWSNSDADSLGQGEYNVFSTDSWWVYEPAVNIRGRAWGLTGVPAPGALGVLGVAGMMALRRRR